MLGQPGCPMPGPAMDGGGPVAAADDAADGDDGDIDHQVPAIAHVARVAERFEVRADGADVDELGHGGTLGSGRRPPLAGPRRAAIWPPGTRQGYRDEVRRARLL